MEYNSVPLDGFSLNLIYGDFSKIVEKIRFIKIEKE
jgi:hypothetical protein